MALALEDIGWGTADPWMRMQASYELAQARRERVAAERIRVRIAAGSTTKQGLEAGHDL